MLWLAITSLAFYILAGFDLLRGNRSIRSLSMTEPVLPQPAPRVSIIIAARNEERHLREALDSLLHLDYPDYDLLVVNDRSDDRTAEILAELCASHEHLSTIDIDHLPNGWLGKNHALWLGSKAARGELLLFSDADIFMHPSLLRRAVHVMLQDQLDHLVASPRMVMPGTLLSMVGLAFMQIFSIFSRPWKARDPNSSHHIGIGAFNLVRAPAYRAVGGHQSIRLRPDDDLKLGKLLKQGGFRQDIVAAPDYMRVEWYATLRELIVGLEKNVFAGCEYRVWLAVGGALSLVTFGVAPFLAVWFTQGATWWFNLATVLVILALQIDCARTNRMPAWLALGWPLAATLFAWIILRTTWLNLSQGGITWRGTFYPLEELKRNRI